MTIIRINCKDAYRISKLCEFNLDLIDEHLFYNGAKLIVRRPYGQQKVRRKQYYISGYHYAGRDTLEIIRDLAINVHNKNIWFQV
jgi:hypothetical protein